MRKKKNISNEVLLAEYEAVYCYARSLGMDEQEAQDMTQETFVKAMEAKERFEGKSSLYTWLCTILKNSWINKCKKQSKEVMTDILPGVLSPNNSDPNLSVEQMITDMEMLKHIHKILHLMDEPYKEVFSLRVFGELSFKDIGELFHKTESWARVTYHRAKLKIVSELDNKSVDSKSNNDKSTENASMTNNKFNKIKHENKIYKKRRENHEE